MVSIKFERFAGRRHCTDKEKTVKKNLRNKKEEQRGKKRKLGEKHHRAFTNVSQ